MKLAIALYPGFTTLDAVGPYEILCRLPDTETVFVAEQTGEVRNDTGSLAIVADASFADIDAADILLVPGGPGSRGQLDELTPVVSWIRRIHETTTWTTSVCTGSLLLGAAGLLDGLDATTHWGAVELLESFGARYTGERVVQRGKIITSAGVSSGIDMALTLAGIVAGDDYAKAIQLLTEYDPQPPYDAGSVAKAGPEIVAGVAHIFRPQASADSRQG
jgi:putative intracellular protease/amidase